MDDRKLSVRVLVGMTIAMIGLELPVFAVPPSSPLLMSQVACKVIKTTPVYKTANTGDSESLMSSLPVGTLVGLAGTLPGVPPARVQIDQPMSGFVDYAALDCGRTSPSTQAKSSVCRTVKNTPGSVSVFRAPNWQSKPIDRAVLAAGQRVYVTQPKGSGSITSQRDAKGGVWVEVDLEKTFNGKNFGILSRVGWLFNSSPGDPNTTLGNGGGCS
jgi:hypothetical protein